MSWWGGDDLGRNGVIMEKYCIDCDSVVRRKTGLFCRIMWDRGSKRVWEGTKGWDQCWHPKGTVLVFEEVGVE
jgi:hypothetical protein